MRKLWLLLLGVLFVPTLLSAQEIWNPSSGASLPSGAAGTIFGNTATNTGGVYTLGAGFLTSGTNLNLASIPNVFTGNHTVSSAEASGIDVCNSLSSMTFSLPQAGSTGFTGYPTFNFVNENTGTCTVSTSTSTFYGVPLTASAIALAQYGFVSCSADANGNYGCMGSPTPGGVTDAALDTLAGASGTQTGYYARTASGTYVLSGGSGAGITALTGDISASGTGSVSATLATVNSNTGTFGSSSVIPVITVNGKGLLTAVSTAAVSGGSGVNPVLLPIMPGYTTDTTGILVQGLYTGSGGNASPSEWGWEVVGSLGSDVTLQLRFQMPPSIPSSGTLNLNSLCISTATTGTAKYTVSDADVATGASPSAATLSAETQTSWSAPGTDKYLLTKTPLTETPAANDTSVVAVKFQTSGWTLAQALYCRFWETWE